MDKVREVLQGKGVEGSVGEREIKWGPVKVDGAICSKGLVVKFFAG